ncbi:hypothetical protein [Nocardiopsis suaedae]|uniref:DNA-binding protein n=1 Tax=Nocardiopsis suaedae TaxID=3018444 RepID=A0ABT4TLZ3_9ACTN|nr:hypothetical protein [Nocardiopsis suaedae]MDA2805720.1 hypothetical protein [Nocardiopsis suaedae]
MIREVEAAADGDHVDPEVHKVEGDVAVTAAEAAAQVGVTRATIDTWVHRGHLAPIPGARRPKRYWLSDVFATEAARRIHPARRASRGE